MATRQFNIFVEGNDDHDLIIALLQERPGFDFDPTKRSKRPTSYLKIQSTGDSILLFATNGWTKLAESEVALRQAKDSGGRNLIVFDADYDDPKYPNGGQLNRTAVIKTAVAAFDPNPAVFLFPKPDEDGNLETLLLRLTQPAHQRVMACYDTYEECLRQFPNTNGEPFYNAPSEKRRIYDYVNVMPMTADQSYRHHEKGGQKIFENADWWNLNSPAIQPLRDFLDAQLP